MKKQNESFLEKNALTIKIIIIGFLIIVLLIPMSMIQSLVMERKERQKEAQLEISSKWGQNQQIIGPVLVAPFKTFDYNENQERINVIKNEMYFLPEDLSIETELIPEIRSRGLFQVVVYRSIIHLSGHFNASNLSINERHFEIEWEGAYLSIGISDLRGIRESVTFIWNDKKMKSGPGASSGLIRSGIIISNLFDRDGPQSNYVFETEIHLNGSQSISFAPVGKETNARIKSSWSSPGFDGAFLPITRKLSDNGFEAEWKVLELNRNYPQKWSGREVNINESLFGVNLIIPVELYQATERSMKYAILFILLTFLVFFLIEIINKVKVHPVHYVLVGSGLSLFYLLLLSLSEHIGFGPAYLTASVAIVLLISGYSKAILKENKPSLMIIVFLSLIYTFLYVLLQLEDFALLVGSSVLFVILAAMMYMASKIDWYSLRDNWSTNKTDDPIKKDS